MMQYCATIPARHIIVRLFHWSPLAKAFNQPTRNTKPGILKGNVGLFLIPQLTTPRGFLELEEDCALQIDALISEALDKGRNRKIVHVFDEISDTVCKVADVAEFVRIAHPDGAFRKAAETTGVAVNGIVETLNTNQELYLALKQAHEKGDVKSLTEVDRLVSALFLFDFEQSGIHLPEAKRNEIVSLNYKILTCGQQFVANSSSVRSIERTLLPRRIRDIFPGTATVAAIQGVYAHSADADIREAGYKLFLQPDMRQEKILMRLLETRQHLARLCGFKTFADRAVKGTTMEDADSVMKFLNIVSDGIYKMAEDDFNILRQMKKRNDPQDRSLACWDVTYFTHKAKKSLFQVSMSEYSAYFSLGTCMEGLNIIFQSCYGISLVNTELIPGEAWAPDIYKLSVNYQLECLGYIYCDFYERQGKPNQDCHFTIRGGKKLEDGTYQLPIIVLTLNLPRPGFHCPPLLTPNLVDNLFHEMGHAMHSMLGRTKYQHVTGTRCSTDVAEVPSILMEYFASDPRILKLFAKHFHTKQTMPDDMIENLCASKKLFTASETQLQVLYAALDHVYHSVFPLEGTSTDIYRQVHERFYGLPYVANTAWQLRFSHLVGYGAKYFSYLVSKALANSIWKAYFEKDPLSRALGDQYRDKFLMHGGGKNPKALIADCLGVNAQPEFLANFVVQEVEECQDKVKNACESLLN